MASNGWENYKKRKGLSVERAAAENTESVSGWEQYKRNKDRESQARNGALAVNPIKRGTYRSEVTAQYDPDDYKNERLAEQAYRIFAGEEAKTSSPGSVLRMGSGEYAAKPVDRRFVGPLTRDYIREDMQEDTAGKLRDLTEFLKQKRDERAEEAAARSFAEELKNSVGPTDINEQVRKSLQVDAGVQEVPAQTSLQKGLAELGLPDFSAPRGQQYQLEADPLTGYTDLEIASRYGIDPETLGRVKRPGLKMGNGEAAKLDPQMIGYDNLQNEPDFAEVLKGPQRVQMHDQVIASRTGLNPMEYNAALTQYMTGEEKNNYQYLLNKYGEAEADKYYATLEDALNQRQGLNSALKAMEWPGWAREMYEMFTAGASGFQGALGGMRNAWNAITQNDQTAAIPASTYAKTVMAQNNGFWGNLAMDLAESFGQQIPQIMMNIATAGLARPAAMITTLAPVGTSVLGNVYNERLKEGYSPKDALKSALASAGLETGLEALGGPAVLSAGALSEKAIDTIVDGIESGVKRFVARTGFDMLGEGAEEALSAALSPLLQNALLENNPEQFDWAELGYQTLVGALSGGVIGAPANVMTGYAEQKKKAVEAAAQGVKNPENTPEQKHNAAKTALEISGVENAEDLADSVVKLANGEKLTQDEMLAIAQTDGALEVAQQIAGAVVENDAAAEDDRVTDESNKVTTVSKVTEEAPEGIEGEQLEAWSNRQQAVEAAAKLGGERRIHEEIYDMGGGQQNAEAYGMEYERAYNRGANNLKLTDEITASYTTLNSEQVQAAWNEGRKAYEATIAKKPVRSNVSMNGKTGLVDATALKGLKLNANQRASISASQTIAEALGIKVVWEASTPEQREKQTMANGWYLPKDQSIHLDIYAGSVSGSNEGAFQYAAMRTFSHELTHYIQDQSPAQYAQLRDMVFGYLQEQGMDVEALIEEKAEAYSSMEDYTRFDVTQEVIADACEMMLRDSAAVKAAMKKDPSLWERIKEKFAQFVEDLRAAFGRVDKLHPEAKALMREAEGVLRYAEELQKKWDEALLSTRQETAEDTNTRATEAEQTAPVETDELAGRETKEPVEYDLGEDVRFSARYDYDELTGKPDVNMVDLSSEWENRDDVLRLARENVSKYSQGSNKTIMYVPDLGHEVTVGRKAIEHGLGGKRVELQGYVAAKIGDILHNSVVINEADPKRNGYDKTWIMLGAARLPNGERVYVRSVIDEREWKLQRIDMLHAATGKIREPAALSAPGVGPKTGHYPTDSKISIADMLKDVKGLFGDVISADVAEKLGIERSESEFTPRLRYQPREEEYVSNRELLANALAGAAQTVAEQNKIAEYKRRVRSLDIAQNRVANIREEMAEINKDLNDKTVRETEKAQLKERLENLKAQRDALEREINEADKVLLKLEATEPLQKVVNRERKAAMDRVRAKANERRDVDKYKQRIANKVASLSVLLTRPTTKKYVPDPIRGPVAEFLSSISFVSKRQLQGGKPTQKDMKFAESLAALQRVMSKVRDRYNDAETSQVVQEGFGGYLDLPEGFVQSLTDLSEKVELAAKHSEEGYNVNMMSVAQLESLDRIITTLKESIQNVNKFLGENLYKHIDQAARDTYIDLGDMRNRSHSTAVGEFFEWENAMPAHAFDRFGRGGKAIFYGLMRGQGKLGMNAKQVTDFANDTYTAEEARKWAEDIKTFKFGEEELKIPVTHIMSLYCLRKREQAQGHLHGEGIRVADFEYKGRKYKDPGRTVDDRMLDEIVSVLTDRQKAVADKLQEYMVEVGSEWGNEVSMRRFGYRAFEEKNYFPINSDGNHLAAVSEEGGKGNAMYALLNISPTKELTPKANNRLMLYNIFDVFANHMSDMAQYNAMALPLLDAIKWINYKESTNLPGSDARHTLSMQDAITKAYGEPAKRYVIRMLEDVSGRKATVSEDKMTGKMLGRVNRAAVAANLRVAVLQPLSLIRAGMDMDALPIVMGFAKNPAHLRENIEKMQKYSGIAVWKDLGFRELNISRGLKKLIKHDVTAMEKVVDKSMALAEAADKFTWAAMWEAAEIQTAKKMSRSEEGFYDAVRDLFERTVYRTQVVDSVLTKSQYMRTPAGMNKWFGAFMSEPVTTYNMLASVVWKISDDARVLAAKDAALKGLPDTKRAAALNAAKFVGNAVKKNMRLVGRTFAVYSASVVATTMLEALMTAWRDDDDYEKFMDKLKETTIWDWIDNANPLAMVPVGSQMWDLFKIALNKFGSDAYGFEMTLPMADIVNTATDLIEMWNKWGQGKGNATGYGVAYKGMQLASDVAGLPFANAAREAISLWNNAVASWAPELRVTTYKTENVKGAQSYIRAVRENNDRLAAEMMDELEANNVTGEALTDAMEDAIKAAYQKGDMDKDESARLLKKYAGYEEKQDDRYEAERLVREWEVKGESGANSQYAWVWNHIAQWDGPALKQEIKELKKLGVEDDQIRDSVLRHFKEIYLNAGRTEKTDLKAHLITALTYMGDTSTKARERIKKWEEEE